MQTVSNKFIELSQDAARTIETKVIINGFDIGSSVIDYSISERLVDSDDFKIGSFAASLLNLRIKNILDVSIGDSIVVQIRFLSSDELHSEWLQIGKFTVDSKPNEQDNVLSIVAYDDAIKANKPYTTALVFPISMQTVFNEAVTMAGYTVDPSLVINPTYTISYYNNTEPMTIREVIASIAGCHGANANISREGKLRFVKIAANDEIEITIPQNALYKIKETNPLRKITNVIGVGEFDNYEAGSGVLTETLKVENKFINQTIVNDINAALNGLTYLPVDMNYKCYPQLELGDRIAIEKTNAKSWEEANTAWSLTEERFDGILELSTFALTNTISFKGGLISTVTSPAASFQESEYKFEGGISKKVNALDQSAVKQDALYNGVTITKEDGLLITRSDKKAKVEFNATTLKMQTGDGSGNYTDALFFDPTSGKFKFQGDVDVSGNITLGAGSYINWNEVNSDPDTASALSAANGASSTASSALSTAQQIANGTYSGGTFISGKAIYSPTIGGANATFTGTISASNVVGSFIKGGTLSIGGISSNGSGDDVVLQVYNGHGRVGFFAGTTSYSELKASLTLLDYGSYDSFEIDMPQLSKWGQIVIGRNADVVALNGDQVIVSGQLYLNSPTNHNIVAKFG